MRLALAAIAGLVASSAAACGLNGAQPGGGGFAPTSSSSSGGGGGRPEGGGPPIPTCTDGMVDGDETDVDCGGSCAPCAIGQGCSQASDCAFACVGHVCVADPVSRWTDVIPSPQPMQAPPTRNVQSVAYDAALKRTILFGGANGNLALADTWAYDGTGWTLLNDGTHDAPLARYFAGLVHDVERAELVLFGGAQTGFLLADTWTYGASGWAQRPTAHAPAGVSRHAMVYDPVRKVTVLFGGYTSVALDETWEFDGTDWTQATPAHKPPPRFDAAAAFDPVNGVVMIYGGTDTDSTKPLGDAWAWDGRDWRTVPLVVPAPGPRSGATMATDPRRRRVLFFGGSDGAGFHGDTWEWDGDHFTLATTPSAPAAAGLNPLVFDEVRQRAVLYLAWDGVASPSQTWEYDVLAVACTKNTDCGSGVCADGLCCETKCGLCAACDTREAPGHCSVVTGREDPDSCHGDHTCDGSGKCVPR